MKTLIIHPDDRSTDFLRPIYSGLEGATVLTKGVSRRRLEKEIRSHDQILMMGHGTPYGLMNVSRIGEGLYAVGEKQVPLLRDKHCIFIWCNADQFVGRHRLKGLYTGMFISEVKEANYCGVPADQETVDASNSRFADLLGGVIPGDSPDYKMIFEHVKNSYGELAEVNKIADYNNQRWYFEPEGVPAREADSFILCSSKIKNYMKKLIIIIISSSIFASCASKKYVYEVAYYQELENTGMLVTTDFIHVSKEDTACWDWYRETSVFKKLMPKSDSVTITYWGTRKEWKAQGR